MVGAVIGCGLLAAWIAPRPQAPPEPDPAVEAVPARPATGPAARSAPARKPARQAELRPEAIESSTIVAWRGVRFGSRIEFAANYISARASVRSTTELTNTAVRLEACISKAPSGSVVGEAAKACLSELVRPR